MSRPFTVEQVAAHNQTTVLDKWWAIIHGEVYRVSNIPLAKCQLTLANVQAALLTGVDVSGLFNQGHEGGNTVRLLKTAQRCHVGTIVQGSAGAQQGQPAHQAQTEQPSGQRQTVHHGHNAHQGQNVQGNQGQIGQPELDDDDEGGTAAERRRREEARNRRLRKAYNPLKQDPDDADEYPADAVAMGYLPDLDGRRWREKRMRLSRYIQYIDGPAVDEEDIDPAAAAWLDLAFSKEIRYKKNLKGGEARGCTGSFRVARPPPPRSQLRPRGAVTDAQRGPPEQDPPDSDASSSSDDDDDDAPGAPALRARQAQVEGRVRQWFPSRSNRTGPAHGQTATPPVTPLNNLAQQTVRPPIQPPPPPPQHPQQMTPEEEQASAKKRRAEELAAAQEVVRRQQNNPAAVDERTQRLWPVQNKTKATPTRPRTPKKTPTRPQTQKNAPTAPQTQKNAPTALQTQKNTSQSSKPPPKKAEKVQPKKGQTQPTQKQPTQKQPTRKEEEEARKHRQRERDFNERKRQNEAKRALEDQEKQQREQQKEDEKMNRVYKNTSEALSKVDPKRREEANRRAEEDQKKEAEAQRIAHLRSHAVQVTGTEAERVRRENREKEAREAQEGRDSQAEAKAQYEAAKAEREAREAQEGRDSQAATKTPYEEAKEAYEAQQGRIREWTQRGLGWEAATNIIIYEEGPLLEDPDKKATKPKSRWPQLPKYSPPNFSAPTYATTATTTNKRPAEPTQVDQDPNKKARKDNTPQTKTGQVSGTGTGTGGKYTDSNRPSWSSTKKQQKQQQTGGVLNRSEDEDEDWTSPDELAQVTQTRGTRSSTAGGPAAVTPGQNVPDLPADLPPMPVGTGPHGTPAYIPIQAFTSSSLIPPPGGIPTTTATTAPATATTKQAATATRPKGPNRKAIPVGLAPRTPIPDDIKALRDRSGSRPSSGPSRTTKR